MSTSTTLLMIASGCIGFSLGMIAFFILAAYAGRKSNN